MSKKIKLVRSRQSKFIESYYQLEVLLKKIRGITNISSIAKSQEGGRSIKIEAHTGGYFMIKPIMRFNKNTWTYWVVPQADNRLKVIWASTIEDDWYKEEALLLTKQLSKYKYNV